MALSALHQLQERANQLVQSDESLRRSIGFQSGIHPSISAYYCTPMGNVMIGTLCAIAVFLWSYHG